MGNDLKLTGNYATDITNLIKGANNSPVWNDAAINDILKNYGKKTDSMQSLLSGTFLSATATSITGSSGQDKLQGTLGQVSILFAQVNSLTPSEPSPTDSTHPSGSLKVGDDGVITTPGGYKIEATKQYEWKITGPDGKMTRVWGDPHVDEGDGGKWDFKRDSTFVLPDGTRINCKTAPWNNMTITKGLEVISGNDRVCVNDIDKGKGKVGDITKDGFANVNSFGNKDVFVMGKESDDWSFKGKEIIGSNNGGDSFKLGNDLPAGEVGPLVEQNKKNGGAEFFTQMYRQISKMFDALIQGMGPGGKMPDMSNMKFPDLAPESAGAFQKDGLDMIKKSFECISAMFTALQKVLDLADTIRRTYHSA
jgi:hypothetical protein